MIAKSRNLPKGMAFCGTRYGNVMASRGSVIPLFVKQIKEGKELTITDPNMTRFMMTLEEAVALVIYAYQFGSNGDIFVHKAPACTIQTLAEAILRVFKASNPIRVIGTRHGEKLFETLMNSEEMNNMIDLGGYFRISADTRDINYSKYFVEGSSEMQEEYTSHNTRRLNVEETIEILLKLDYIKENL
jgi:UDP-glucose 4-epimerase